MTGGITPGGGNNNKTSFVGLTGSTQSGDPIVKPETRTEVPTELVSRTDTPETGTYGRATGNASVKSVTTNEENALWTGGGAQGPGDVAAFAALLAGREQPPVSAGTFQGASYPGVGDNV